MFERRTLLVACLSFCLLVLVPIGLWGQTPTTGMVQGQVTDPTNAVIPGAKVVLTSTATGVATSTTTDATGRYVFPVVVPGDYTLRVSSTGFKDFVVSEVVVQVNKSYGINAKLQVGAATSTVTVTDIPGASLQTTNASIGTTIGGNALLFLPASQRNVTSLLSLQPAVTPMIAGDDVFGGQVAGAASDQTTFLVDGGDATDDLAGTNGYAAVPGQPEPSPFIAVNNESTQEFRVVSASPTSGFSRSQGGEVSIVSKRGTNSFHGSAYEYWNGNTLGANSWTNNTYGIPKPHKVNNRFGGTFGGPIFKNRLWFYGNYEGRRFRQSTSITTDVPTYCARNGVLRFKDAAGNVNSYNFDPSVSSQVASACGVSVGQPVSTLDPRGIGIDPMIFNYWQNEPLPNAGGGDGLNSQRYTASYAEPTNEDYGLGRIDYKINQRWQLYSTFRYQKLIYLTSSQFDITPGHQGLISGTPVQPRFATFMLTGQIGSHFTMSTHGSFMRDWWAWNRQAPANPSGISGLGGTLQVSGEGRTGTSGTGKPWADPINYNTQNARARLWAAKDWYLAEDDSWLHGNHNFSFGGAWYFWNITHLRTDNVLGGLTNGPIYWVGSRHMSSGSFVDTPTSQAPTVCSAPGEANCLRSSDATRWDSMYSALLGMVDHSSQVITANGNFQPNPPGTPAITTVHIGSIYTYFQDMWQMKPSITLTYGLSWGAQFPPKEVNGKQVMQVYTGTNIPVTDLNSYFQARQNALDQGNPYPLNESITPSFSFIPINHVPGHTRPVSTYYGQFGPRFAIAWQPSFSNRFFGSHQTVIRAGYSLLWNRTSAVGLVMTPLLGDGLAQIVSCNGPDTSATCTGARTNASNAFRVGIDGSSLPQPAAQSGYPLTPPSYLSSIYGFNLDPNWQPPWSHNITFDIQRSFPHNWLIDIGYIGRFSRNLENGGDINASDMFAKDPRSGQTLAQAFDAVSTFFRNGGSCDASGQCPGLAPQPFFENMAVPANVTANGGQTGPQYCQSTYGMSCTWVAASSDSGDAINGSLGGFMEFNYDFIAQAPLDPMQFVLNFWNYGGGWANYNAGFISAHKSFSQGLDFTFNYTWSHALGTQALNQEYIIYGNPSPFNQSTGYGTAAFDRRNVFNSSWYYQLPFGQGKRFSSSSNFLNRIIGGWYSSGIWTWQSGLPMCIAANGDYGDIGAGSVNQTCAQSTSPLWGMASQNRGVNGSNGIGTNGNPANGGSGINMFANPAAVFAGFSRPLLTQNLRPFDPNIAQPSTWNVDLSIGKNIVDTERYKAIFTADLFNAFNLFQPDWGGVSLDMNDPSGFGVVTAQGNSPRSIQLGLRFEF
jgi:hypothetical protein